MDRNSDDPTYAKDAVMKEDYKRTIGIGRDMTVEEGARLRLDVECENYLKNPEAYQSKGLSSESPANNYGGSPTNQSGPLETIEQERNRLSNKLNQTLAENEMRMRVLRDILEGLERWQKNGYFLRDSINQSSRVKMDQVHQLRDYLK